MAEEHSSVWLIRDEEHSHSTHERWVARRNRDTGDPDYKEEWYGEQCGGCTFYVPLAGRFGEDWGVCSNEKSPFDGKAVFEHDGCEEFANNPEGWAPPV